MKKIILIIFTTMFILSACNQSSTEKKMTLDPNTFDEMINKKTDEIILDVRTPEEFSSGHIPGAILMNIKEADFETQVKELDKTKPVFVYCLSGIRSEKASAILTNSGFKEVYHLEDGLKAWTNSGKELIK